MTKTLTHKEQVAVFVRYQPNCAVGMFPKRWT